MTLQETIIAQLGVKPSIDPKEEIRKFVADIVIGQRDYKHKERQELFKENMDYVNMTGKTAAENIYNKLKEL